MFQYYPCSPLSLLAAPLRHDPGDKPRIPCFFMLGGRHRGGGDALINTVHSPFIPALPLLVWASCFLMSIFAILEEQRKLPFIVQAAILASHLVGGSQQLPHVNLDKNPRKPFPCSCECCTIHLYRSPYLISRFA